MQITLSSGLYVGVLNADYNVMFASNLLGPAHQQNVQPHDCHVRLCGEGHTLHARIHLES